MLTLQKSFQITRMSQRHLKDASHKDIPSSLLDMRASGIIQLRNFNHNVSSDTSNCIVLGTLRMSSIAFIEHGHDGIINEIEIRADSARIAAGTLQLRT